MTINLDFTKAGAAKSFKDFLWHELLIFVGTGGASVANDLGTVHVSTRSQLVLIGFSSVIAAIVHIVEWVRTKQVKVDAGLTQTTEFSGVIAPEAQA